LIYAQAIALAFHGVEAQTFAAKTFPRAKQTQTMSNSPHRSFEKSTRDDLARLAQIARTGFADLCQRKEASAWPKRQRPEQPCPKLLFRGER
jgi:hypothetical protein